MEKDIRELKKDSDRGSLEAKEGKLPIGKESGFIDVDWVKKETGVDGWHTLVRGLNSGSTNSSINAYAIYNR